MQLEGFGRQSTLLSFPQLSIAKFGGWEKL